jgi:predicted flap endonuclease-1-like 5' DNA nuclease
MNNSRSTLTHPLVILFGTVLIGFLLTFVLITRLLWPVQWYDAAPYNLDTASQQQYLRMAIDSYAVHPDDNLAVTRYQELGEYAESTLATIMAAPGNQDPAEIANFAAVVGAAGPVPAPPPPPVSQIWIWLGILLLFLLLAAVVWWVVDLYQQRQAAEAGTQAGDQPLWMEEDSLPEGYAPLSSETETVVPTEAEEPAPESGEPDWLATFEEPEQPEEPEPDQPSIGLMGAAAAGVAGAAAMAALSHDEEEPEPEAEPEPEEESQPADSELGELPDWFAELEDEEEAGGVDAAGALGAAAALGALHAEEEQMPPPPEEEALPSWLAEFAEGESEEPEVEESSPEEMAKFHKELEYIEGIGPVYASRLNEVGIKNPLDLLESGATPRGRADIAEQTGISSKLILTWVNHVDLYRLKGVGSEYADLLEAAGVDTVVELATRNPENLHNTLLAVNSDKDLVRQPPSLGQVEDWIEQAKNLPRKVTY